MLNGIKCSGVLAAPLLMFALNLPSHADTTAADVPTTCKDGTSSTSSGRGTCSGHGGVQKAPKVAAAPAATPPPAGATSTSSSTATAGAGATAKCKDGTYSKSKTHAGSCSSHGGVAQFLTPAP